MTVKLINIIPRKQAENSQTTQYTAVNVTTVIDKFTVTNNTTSNVTFAVNLVVLAGSPGDSNKVLPTMTILPGGTYLCPELVGQVLEAGGYISTIAGTTTALTISASGREIT